MANEEIAKLSLQTALRTLDLQQREVQQLRLRSGVMLAACSLIASIFGGAAIKANHGVGAPGALALATLAASTSLCVYLLTAKRRLIFAVDAQSVYGLLLDSDGDARAFAEVIAWLAAYGRENDRELSGLDRVYTLAALCLMAQMVCWSIVLAATLR